MPLKQTSYRFVWLCRTVDITECSGFNAASAFHTTEKFIKESLLFQSILLFY